MTARPDRRGRPGRLAPCPSSPNCVSSQADPGDRSHFLAPIPYPGTDSEAMTTVRAVIAAMPRARLIASSDCFLHAEFRTLVMRFVDDVEVMLDSSEKVIHFRSASRVGYYDLGVNRRRMRRIKGRVLKGLEERTEH